MSLTYINNNYIRSDGTTPVSGSIDMRGNTLYNVSDPVNPQDVATKEYADQVGGGSPFLKENGNYKATHTINIAYNKLVNLYKPTEPYDAATKDYVDYVKSILNKRLNTIDKRPHIIAVHANYHGRLREGEFQFAFGGNTIQPQPNGSSGFLIPHSGRITKIRGTVADEKGRHTTSGISPVLDPTLTKNDLFNIISINDDGDVTNLISVYNCNDTYDADKAVYTISCGFTPDPKNISISEGEILTIRTTDYWSISHIDDLDKTFSYLFTFLIELDPL